jgi:hypothetical protein
MDEQAPAPAEQHHSRKSSENGIFDAILENGQGCQQAAAKPSNKLAALAALEVKLYNVCMYLKP